MLIGVKAYEMTDSQNGMKGLATVTFGDSFKVRSIAIVEGKEGKPFVALLQSFHLPLPASFHLFFTATCAPAAK